MRTCLSLSFLWFRFHCSFGVAFKDSLPVLAFSANCKALLHTQLQTECCIFCELQGIIVVTVLCYNYNAKRELFRTYVCWLLSSRPVVHKCCFWQRKIVIQKMVWFCKVNSYSLLSLYILLDSLDCSSAMPTSTTSILTFSLFCSSPTESVHFAC